MIAKNKNKLLIPSILLLGAILFNVTISFASAFEVHEIAPEIMLELTNKSRKENGMPELALDAKLQQASEAKANDMFENQYFDHVSPDGVTPWEFIKSAGYEYVFAGENLAIDFATAEGVQRAFMNSASHRQNILSANYSNVGIAVKKGIMKEREVTIVVVEFGSPLNKTTSVLQVDSNLNGELIIFPVRQTLFSYYKDESRQNIKKVLREVTISNPGTGMEIGFENLDNYEKILAYYNSFEKEIMLILLSFAISMNMLYISEEK